MGSRTFLAVFENMALLYKLWFSEKLCVSGLFWPACVLSRQLGKSDSATFSVLLFFDFPGKIAFVVHIELVVFIYCLCTLFIYLFMCWFVLFFMLLHFSFQNNCLTNFPIYLSIYVLYFISMKNLNMKISQHISQYTYVYIHIYI